MSKRVLFAVTAILLMVSGCGGSNCGHSAGSSTPHPNPFAGEKARVAYHTTHNDLESVWLVHPDGTENHQVTTDVPSQQQQLLPDWSPDGKRLVFATHCISSTPAARSRTFTACIQTGRGWSS